MRLSKKRAKEIKKYLVSQGINKSRLSAVGFGANKMVYNNPSSEKEKEANRRVEIMIR
jgi:outer membrane protein OmpA-like peptidoglycan-associated protein